MAHRRVARRAGVVATVTAAAVFVASCGGTGYNYVKSSDFNTYFRVPKEWRVFEEKTVVTALAKDQELSDEQRSRVLDSSWRTMFDASPKPKLGHVNTFSRYPTGNVVSTYLSAEESLNANDGFLLDYFFGVSEAANEGRLTVLESESVNREGGFHGVRILGRLVLGDANAEGAYEGPAVTFDQTVMIDQQRSRVFGMFVSCSAKCYEKHKGKITRVVDSWTVTDK